MFPLESVGMICWLGFVGRITEKKKKQQNGFPRDLDDGWFSAQNGPHRRLARILIRGRIQEFLLAFFIIRFWLISQVIMHQLRWLVSVSEDNLLLILDLVSFTYG